MRVTREAVKLENGISQKKQISSFNNCIMKPSMISAKHRYHSTSQQGQSFHTWCAHRGTCRIKPVVTKVVRKQNKTPEDLGENVRG